MKFIKTIVVTALALMAAAYIIPGFKVDNFSSALVASIVLGIANAVIRPILLFLTLPINILTLGLFSFVINIIMIGLAAFFVPGFSINGLLPALLGSIIVSFVSSFLNSLIKD